MHLVHDLPDQVSASPAEGDGVQGLSATLGTIYRFAAVDESELQPTPVRAHSHFDFLVTPVIVSVPDDVAERLVNGERKATTLLLFESKDSGKLRNCVPHHRQQPRIAWKFQLEIERAFRLAKARETRRTLFVATHRHFETAAKG